MLGLLVFKFIWLVLVLVSCSWLFELWSCALSHCSFSKSMESANIVNCFKYLFTSSHFRTGQSSSLDVYAISLSLSLSSMSQSNMRWSVVWSPWVQAHSGVGLSWSGVGMLWFFRVQSPAPWNWVICWVREILLGYQSFGGRVPLLLPFFYGCLLILVVLFHFLVFC